MAVTKPLVFDYSDAKSKLDAVIKFFKSRKMVTEAGKRVLEIASDAHSAQKDPVTGSGWQRLSPNTIAAKGSATPARAIGQSLKRGAKDNIFRVSGFARAEVGTKSPGAAFVQLGTRSHKIKPRRARKLRFVTVSGVTYADEVKHPGTSQRRFLGLSRADAAEIAAMLRGHMLESMRRK
jgi:phage gpG-like protein